MLKEESSFCEQKEAKKLHPLVFTQSCDPDSLAGMETRTLHHATVAGGWKFFGSFFKKEPFLTLPATTSWR
jgi:hypothetical protein